MSPSKEKGPEYILLCIFIGFSSEIHTIHIKLINQCLKSCSLEKLTPFTDNSEETQGSSLVRVSFSSSVCFIATGQSRS